MPHGAHDSCLCRSLVSVLWLWLGPLVIFCAVVQLASLFASSSLSGRYGVRGRVSQVSLSPPSFMRYTISDSVRCDYPVRNYFHQLAWHLRSNCEELLCECKAIDLWYFHSLPNSHCQKCALPGCEITETCLHWSCSIACQWHDTSVQRCYPVICIGSSSVLCQKISKAEQGKCVLDPSAVWLLWCIWLLSHHTDFSANIEA